MTVNKTQSQAQALKEQTTLLNYNGIDISVEVVNGINMLNATQMANAFGKRPNDWASSQQAEKYMNAVSVTRNLVTDDLQLVRQGGQIQGTWLQEDVALAFAQWLDPMFHLMCNDRLKQLLTQDTPNLEPKHGVQPILYLGKKIYPYKDAVGIFGGSTRSSASKRKKRHPKQFTKVFGRNFITEAYLDLLQGYYAYRNALSSNQLNLGL